MKTVYSTLALRRRDADWRALAEELDAWQSGDRTATLWWRDDDAAAPSAALDRLLALRARQRVPLSLAVVPAGAEPSLDARLAEAGDGVAVLQHGYAHQNHAAAGAKKIELGGERLSAHVVSELAVGQQRLEHVGGWLPVLVPPWNRIAAHLVPMLPEIGFRGLSTFGARHRREPVAGLVQANTHVDPVNWREGRSFVGTSAALNTAVAHLRARREGQADANEPTGLLTHHLVDDAATWSFVEAFVEQTTAHPAAAWLAGATVFGAP